MSDRVIMEAARLCRADEQSYLPKLLGAIGKDKILHGLYICQKFEETNSL